MVKGFAFLYAAAVLVSGTSAFASEPFDHNHSLFAQVLATNVHDGAVDYRPLKNEPAMLDRYLRAVSEVSEKNYTSWTREQKLAFLINTYNASVLQLVRDHYPVDSIKRIGGWFGSPFRQRFINLRERTLSLDDLEHGIIRPEFHEPRVHFALVCAARSCPILRAEPYLAERLDQQLSDQGKLFLGDSSKNRVDSQAGVVYLSPIFKWYSEDFGKDQNAVIEFVKPYFAPPLQRELGGRSFRLRYTDYDWNLNDVKN